MNPLEVYISYTTSEDVRITNERVYLDNPIEASGWKIIFYFYDVISDWVLALPSMPHTISEKSFEDSVQEYGEEWESGVDKELKLTEKLHKLGLMSRCSTPCKVTLKNKLGTYYFDSFLSRNPRSLRNEDIYIIEQFVSYTEYGGKIPIDDQSDYEDPSPYFDLFKPLLWELRILAENGYTSQGGAIVDHEDKPMIRLLCRGETLRPVSFNDYKEIDYTYAIKGIKRDFDAVLLGDIISVPPRKWKNLIEELETQCMSYLENLRYEDAVDNIKKLNRFSRLNCELTDKEPKVGKSPEERTIQLLEATNSNNQSKRYIVELFYRGVDIFYKDGQILANSVKLGSDYMLRLMSLIPGRLEKFLSYASSASNLFSSIFEVERSVEGHYYNEALKYILAHDKRSGRENSVSYNELIKEMNYNPSPLNNLYIIYKGPMYEKVIDARRV